MEKDCFQVIKEGPVLIGSERTHLQYIEHILYPDWNE